MVMEEFWRVDPGCGNILLSVFGSEIDSALMAPKNRRRNTFLLFTKGEAIMGTAITEPDAGSDITLDFDEAKKDKDGYVSTGSKQFITNGTYCQLSRGHSVSPTRKRSRG